MSTASLGTLNLVEANGVHYSVYWYHTPKMSSVEHSYAVVSPRANTVKCVHIGRHEVEKHPWPERGSHARLVVKNSGAWSLSVPGAPAAFSVRHPRLPKRGPLGLRRTLLSSLLRLGSRKKNSVFDRLARFSLVSNTSHSPNLLFPRRPIEAAECRQLLRATWTTQRKDWCQSVRFIRAPRLPAPGATCTS